MGERAGLVAKTPEVKQSNSNSRVRRSECLQSMNTPVDRILFLQRTAGNQAVSRLMKSRALQAKLRIGQHGDVYEQEADRVAEQVMRMPEPVVQRQVEPEEEEEETLQSKPLASQITPLVQVQRQEEPEEEEEETLNAKPLVEETTPLVQRQVEPEEEEEEIQPKSLAGPAPEVTPEMGRDIQSIKGAGQPLSASERAFFEPRLGADFGNVRVHSDARASYVKHSPLWNDFVAGLSSVKSGGRPLTKKARSEFEHAFDIDFGKVRIHTDSQAVQMSQDIGAQAFTHKNHIFFNEGKYNPEAIEGKRLLAHELTHTIQQQTFNKSNVWGELTLSNPKDAAEQEAVSAANRVVTGRSVRVTQSVSPYVLSAWRGIFDITTRLPKSRKFSVTSGFVRVESTTRWRRPASCPAKSKYTITLWRYRWYMWDKDHGSKSYPVPGTGIQTWGKLPKSTYYLEIYWPNTNSNCRIDGNLNVTH